MIDELIAKLQFWYVRNFFKVEKHYTFYLDLAGKKDTFAVKILKTYPDTIVEFSNIHMDDNGLLQFDQNVIANPKLHKTESKRFKNFTSNIMRSIILGSIENYEKEKNENRKSDLVQSDSERGIHEEVSALFEERVPERKPRKKTIRGNKTVRSKVQQSASDSSAGDQS